MSLQETRDAIARVSSATTYAELFGDVASNVDEADRHVRREARRLARYLHPDACHGQVDGDQAAAAYIRLQQMLDQAITALQSGVYGTVAVIATITSRHARHEVTAVANPGDITDTYLATTYRGTDTLPAFLKIARTPADNDLLGAEAEAIKRLRATTTDVQYTSFVPEVVDTFRVGDTAARRAGTALRLLEGFYPLTEVTQRFRGAVEPLDAAWVWRRLLAALGFAHDHGVIHGAVVPQHVMIHPELHGLVLVDWCAAVLEHDGSYSPIKVVTAPQRDWYPPEVLAKQAPSPATDLVMAARTMIYAMGGDPVTGVLPAAIPRPLRAFFRGCLATRQLARPQNAWLLLQEFDELLESMGAPYFPRRFRPMTLPTGRV